MAPCVGEGAGGFGESAGRTPPHSILFRGEQRSAAYFGEFAGLPALHTFQDCQPPHPMGNSQRVNSQRACHCSLSSHILLASGICRRPLTTQDQASWKTPVEDPNGFWRTPSLGRSGSADAGGRGELGGRREQAGGRREGDGAGGKAWGGRSRGEAENIILFPTRRP